MSLFSLFTQLSKTKEKMKISRLNFAETARCKTRALRAGREGGEQEAHKSFALTAHHDAPNFLDPHPTSNTPRP